GRARKRLSARAGSPRRPLRLCDPRQLADGRPQPRPRPSAPSGLTSQLDPTVELIASPPEHLLAPPPVRVSGRRLHVPGWLLLLLKNPKSCAGLAMVAFVVVIALIAPLISVAHPN